MSVRAKFTVDRIEGQTISAGPVYLIHMNPVYTGSDENARFFAATPGGEIVLFTVNETAAEQFAEGKSYYVDFTEAP